MVSFAACAAISANAAQRPFSSAPLIPLHDYELRYGMDVQKFNGTFVRDMVNEIRRSVLKNCLLNSDDSVVTVKAFASGSVAIYAVSGQCSTPSKESAEAGATAELTSTVKFGARRLAGMITAVEDFSGNPRFATNDRNLSSYDVEVFNTPNGVVHINLLPRPDPRSFVAGCPHTGTIAVGYLYDPGTSKLSLGRMAC